MKRLAPVKFEKNYEKDGDIFVKNDGWRTTLRFSDPSAVPQIQANDTTAYEPEVWAAESIMSLVENMVFASTVHRDFDEEVSKFGRKVYTREPGTFVGKRKQNDLDDVETQDVTAREVEVTLDQRVYVSFVLGDEARTYSMKDLVEEYLKPAMEAEARFLDQAVAAECIQFRSNIAGALGAVDKTNAHDYLLDARKIMNDNKNPLSNRWMALTSGTETSLQKVELFKDASSVGDAGQALRDALIGRKEGFNTFLELNLPSPSGVTLGSISTTVNGAVAAGQTVVTVASGTGILAGMYLNLAGENTPMRVASVSTNDITFTTPLVHGVANGAAVTDNKNGAVNQNAAILAGDRTAAVSDGYPANWVKGIVIDGTTPVEGQMLAFAGTTAEYVVIQATAVSGGTEVLLDRPLEDTVADNAVVNLGPAGNFNFGYHRDAIALVNRPLALPISNTGVRAGLGIMNDMAMRVTIAYDPKSEGTRVTIGSLFGKKTLNTGRGVLFVG